MSNCIGGGVIGNEFRAPLVRSGRANRQLDLEGVSPGRELHALPDAVLFGIEVDWLFFLSHLLIEVDTARGGASAAYDEAQRHLLVQMGISGDANILEDDVVSARRAEGECIHGHSVGLGRLGLGGGVTDVLIEIAGDDQAVGRRVGGARSRHPHCLSQSGLVRSAAVAVGGGNVYSAVGSRGTGQLLDVCGAIEGQDRHLVVGFQVSTDAHDEVFGLAAQVGGNRFRTVEQEGYGKIVVRENVVHSRHREHEHDHDASAHRQREFAADRSQAGQGTSGNPPHQNGDQRDPETPRSVESFQQRVHGPSQEIRVNDSIGTGVSDNAASPLS